MSAIRSIGAALAALTIAILHAPTPASAGLAPATEPQPEACVSLALSRGADIWTCTSEMLVEVDVNDQGEPQPPVYTPIEQPIVSSEPAATAGEGVTDDWDTWCETGSICRRWINSGASETKGNAAYGNQSGVIGTYDLVIRTNMNGRYANHGLALIWDSGPSLDFNDVYVRCREDRNNLPDNNCGDHYAGGPLISAGTWRWNSGTVLGNKLNNANPYFAEVTANFIPTGYPFYIAAPLRTMKWTCPSNLANPCYFP
ncbi:hypothetical protein [Micromonospora inyonensis]|uniref:Secreted protein n=1 Tax=Micromonospora inyonensis TaxID=47866 RepID=A0A1C6RCY4_9ACTN|nr:hypothetical protein [Micromonospora inyonensis]SCL15009.1 hypothetical protein GA0074694_1013 [Micromonospora inyonensis]SCL33530.1 hypothetical protein GA0074694_6251 [Micromonospora inyonensis]